jgi:hypothetical protein
MPMDGFKTFILKYRRSIMSVTNTSEKVRVDMPKTSGDPETLNPTPVGTEEQQPKETGKKEPPPKK